MRAILLTLAAMSLTACIGTLDNTGGNNGSNNGSDNGSDIGPPLGQGSDMGGDGGGSATARDFFNNSVYVAIANTCGNAGCHSATTPGTNAPGFVNQTAPTTDDSAAWTTITGMTNVVGTFTTTAPILSIPAGAHYAKFTPAQVDTITQWLNLETAWRNTATGGTPQDYLADWSGCMQIQDFIDSGVAKAYARQVDTNQGYCENCHVNGQAQSYFIANPDPEKMFNAMTTYREYLSTYFTVDTASNSVVLNMAPYQLAANGGINGEHPKNWDPANNNGMQAMQQFLQLTMAHQNGTTAPACGPSTLMN